MSFEMVETSTETTNDASKEKTDVGGTQTTDSGVPAGSDVQPESTTDTTGTPDAEEGGEPAGTPEGDAEPAKEEAGSSEEITYYWGDDAVEIEIADDVSAALSEKGLDAKAIAAEMYSKGSDFRLSDETKQKLYDAFGKFSVDAYLSGLKAQNEMYMLNSQRDMERAEQANTERYQAVSQEIGGDEGWSRLETYALEKLSDDELTAFNEVMNSGNQYLQAYAVRELESRRLKEQGDDKVNLISGSPVGGSDNAPLTREAYIKEMAQLGSRYGNDRAAHANAQASLDSRRRAGMNAGL